MLTRTVHSGAYKFARHVVSEPADAGFIACAVCGESFFQNIATKKYCSQRCGKTAQSRRRRGEPIAGAANRKITTTPKGKNYISKYAPGSEA